MRNILLDFAQEDERKRIVEHYEATLRDLIALATSELERSINGGVRVGPNVQIVAAVGDVQIAWHRYLKV